MMDRNLGLQDTPHTPLRRASLPASRGQTSWVAHANEIFDATSFAKFAWAKSFDQSCAMLLLGEVFDPGANHC
jgi:hypothetical protein